MNRGQLKRLRKELERLQNGGKDWDALKLIERENAIDEFRSEWDDLWKSQSRHAVRTAALMDTFLLQIDGFATVPDSADIRFMRMVGDYLDGSEVTAAINDITGLSAPAEALRRELLRRGTEKRSDDTKLRKLLTSFAATPEKVLQKDYRQLGTLLSSHPAVSPLACATLVELLSLSRKLNSASAVKYKERGVAESELKMIDLSINKTKSDMPQPLFNLVITPVLLQVCAALCRVAEFNPNVGARLALAAPFCMENLAGTNWPELRKRFQFEAGLTFSSADLADLRKTARDATFEERFILINKVAGIMSSRQDFDEGLQDILIILFKGLFKDLIARRATISERDQRRLTAVFGPFFLRHRMYLYGNPEDLPFLLDAAAAAGCLDIESALLQTFFAVMARDRAMIANARAMLKLLPPADDNDIKNLFHHHQEYFAEDLKTLKGMLDICRECGHELDAAVAKHLGVTFQTALLMNTLMSPTGHGSLMSMLMGSMPDQPSRICKKMLKGMECFAGNPVFSVPLMLASSFPSGRISGAEFGQMLKKQIDIDQSAENALINLLLLLEVVRKFGESQDINMPFGDVFDCGSLVMELLIAALDVLCGKKELAEQRSTDSLTTLVNAIHRYGNGNKMERYILIISNVAAERKEAGETTAGKLYDITIDYLSKVAKPDKKRGRKR